MEALVALGLASNVIQFVDFSLKIYGKTREVISSAHGATQFNFELEQFCLRLEDFGSKLSSIGPSTNQHSIIIPSGQGDLARRHGDTIRQHVDGVNKIASECTLVCHELLIVLKSLRHDSSGRLRLPKALAQVFREQLKSKKVAHLESKLKDFQPPLLLHLSALLNERQKYMTDLLEKVASNHHERQFSQTKRFDDLTGQLKTMASDISAFERKLRRQAITETHNLHARIKDLEHLLSGLRLSEEGIGKAAKEQELIQSLDFPEKTWRHEKITEAHRRTFEWVLQSRNEPHSASPHGKEPIELSQGCDFYHWLQNGNGVFWITGKPGSGKSTLMKFIAGHDKTRHALKLWAGVKEVVIASHYFWSIGTEKQKAERGLLQKMVFDVLSQCPQLAWDIFPKRCRHGHRTSTAASFSLPHGEAWPLAELRQALLLLSQVTSVPVKFCFFIDGLDEYSEDRIDLCKTVMGFAKSENVKCCVSSRPWNEFETMFGGDRSALLRVHELTQNDIWKFAHDRLTSVPGEMDNPDKESFTTSLVDNITKRAEGVFLWVFLVTKELREGMSNGYTMDDLSALLVSVPSELEDYFKHMMDSVHLRNHPYMAKTLQIALVSKSAHRLDVYHAHELKDVDADFALSMPIKYGSTFLNRDFYDYKACKQRINDRCRGLLSFSKSNDVDFIHRTVHSYLINRPMQDYLHSKVDAAFHPNLATVESLIFLTRHKMTVDLLPGDFLSLRTSTFQTWHACPDYLACAIEEDKESTIRLVDNFANLQYRVEPGTASSLQHRLDSEFITPGRLIWLTATWNSTASNTDIGSNNHDMVKLCSKGTMLASNCLHYVMARLRDNQDYFRADGISALAVVLTIDTKTYLTIGKFVIELLEMGFDPNECLEPKTTPWELFLDFTAEIDHGSPALPLYYDIVLSFLHCGADKSLLRNCSDNLVRNIIHGICGGTRPKLLQNILAALFDTPLRTKALFLERFVYISSKRRYGDRSIEAEMAGIVEMISIEMINVSLNKKGFKDWLSSWDSISPRLKAMAEDYLRASPDEESSVESQSDVGEVQSTASGEVAKVAFESHPNYDSSSRSLTEMSIDFNWETLTTGPDGQELAHRIRDFIHSKFQTVPLPRFIKSVTVHDFEFGSIGPELELKDITDPLPDFYEEDEDDEGDGGSDDDGSDDSGDRYAQHEYDRHGPPRRRTPDRRGQQRGEPADGGQGQNGQTHGPGHRHGLSSSSHQTLTGHQVHQDQEPYGRPSTRGGVPGGTSNLLHHFHNHLAPAGWSGTQTPLAAMASAHLSGAGAGGGYFQEPLQAHGLQGLQGLQGLHGYHGSRRSPSPSHSRNPSQSSSISIDNHRDSLRLTPATATAAVSSSPPHLPLLRPTLREKHSVSTLAPTSAGGASRPPTRDGRDGSRGGDKLSGMTPALAGASAVDGRDNSSQEHGDDDVGDMDRTLLLGQADGSGPGRPGSGRRRFREPRAEDTQAVFRIKYAGDVKLLLTADILLDYPMPSFVGIPVRLSITGLTFDGVGVLANIRKRLHFCFLSPEDALAAVGDDDDDEEEEEDVAIQDARAAADNYDGGLAPMPTVPGRRHTASSTVPPPLPPYSTTNPHTPGTSNPSQPPPPPPPPRTKTRMGGLLQEVRVESEIGQREGGKQSLKNVGKVERFVLEQVRRIFEEEFVYPSFWTFLV